jgi:hypothetical protein
MYDSYTVVVMRNDTFRTITTTEWEAELNDGETLEQRACDTVARMCAGVGTADVTISVHMHNA